MSGDRPEDRVLPFPALTGQTAMIRALLLLAVNPKLPGLLLARERQPTVERRPPFVTLPLGITEDQLLGTLDLEGVLPASVHESGGADAVGS
jgi:Mg-chelatase subunit ChlI